MPGNRVQCSLADGFRCRDRPTEPTSLLRQRAQSAVPGNVRRGGDLGGHSAANAGGTGSAGAICRAAAGRLQAFTGTHRPGHLVAQASAAAHSGAQRAFYRGRHAERRAVMAARPRPSSPESRRRGKAGVGDSFLPFFLRESDSLRELAAIYCLLLPLMALFNCFHSTASCL